MRKLALASGQLSIFEKAKSIPHQSVSLAAYRGEPYLMQILFVLLAVAVVGYIYFVGVSIMNVIVSRESSLESERLQSSVASLEQEYFALSKEVGADAAAQHGLAQPTGTTFVRRDANYAANVTRSDIR